MKPNWHFIVASILLLAMLVVSIALNILLYSRAKQYYLQLNETRLDPLGLYYYTTNSGRSNPDSIDNPMVVFFGDSRAANWPSPDLSQFNFVNRGIGSQTSEQVLQRFDYHVEPLKPHVIVVQVGINDLKTIPLFPERKESIIDNCQKNIWQLVARSSKLKATVILTTVFPFGKVPIGRRLVWSHEATSGVDKINIYIRSLAKERVIVFDAFSILADSKGNARSEYSKDFLHLNAAGYKVLNRELERLLATMQIKT